LPAGDYDSRPLLDALRVRGLRADIRAWNDESVDWSEASITIIRSTWDYHEQLPAFLEWIDRTSAVTALFNPAPLIRWNTDKRYLLDLYGAGIDTVPTVAFDACDVATIDAALAARGWNDVVLKPAVSLDGHGVHRATIGSASMKAALVALAGAGPLIAQPFMPRIIRTGELSLAFIRGAFSHAVRKRAAPGEFRVQERLGGTVEPAAAPAGSVEFGEAVLETLDIAPLYARVDIIEGDHAPFLLTELELVEPSLFLATDPGAAVRFAAAIETLAGR
jgi:glutathione synthase/RimK-type ligase-like ATP-grasp enzyme